MARTPVSYDSGDYFKSFRNRHPKVKIERKEHALILATTGEVISEMIIQDGIFKLFSRMGRFLIRCIKPKAPGRRLVDYNATRLTGKKVYHFNDHSNGMVAKLIWNKEDCIIADKFMWSFKPVRSFKRLLAQRLKAGEVQYPIQL